MALDSHDWVPVDSDVGESSANMMDSCIFSSLSCDDFKHLCDGFGVIFVDLENDLSFIKAIEIDMMRNFVKT